MVVASWGLGVGSAYPLLKAPRHVWPEARILPWVEEGARMGRHVVKSCLHTTIGGWKEWRCGLLPGLVLFSLVVPPLQLRVVGPYPVWGVWFPSRLPLEWTGHIYNLGHNQWHILPGVLDPDNLAIFACYSNQLLRRWIWRILWWGVLGLRCPRCFHVDSGAFCWSTFVRVVLVWMDNIYVIIILYPWHLAISE
jgi:hypothetical protein